MNLGLLAVFAITFVASWWFLDRQFVATARQDVLQNARICAHIAPKEAVGLRRTLASFL